MGSLVLCGCCGDSLPVAGFVCLGCKFQGRKNSSRNGVFLSADHSGPCPHCEYDLWGGCGDSWGPFTVREGTTRKIRGKLGAAPSYVLGKRDLVYHVPDGAAPQHVRGLMSGACAFARGAALSDLEKGMLSWSSDPLDPLLWKRKGEAARPSESAYLSQSSSATLQVASVSLQQQIEENTPASFRRILTDEDLKNCEIESFPVRSRGGVIARAQWEQICAGLGYAPETPIDPSARVGGTDSYGYMLVAPGIKREPSIELDDYPIVCPACTHKSGQTVLLMRSEWTAHYATYSGRGGSHSDSAFKIRLPSH
uniref:Uncharacterized protein n=1 Tax=Chromera velia CCMP2878 TaxID=1169474 RepID=A0A0G4HZ61_9ALVE|eukprot:Cvel_9656.t1-p1 / transcript=Cvel_9656.t1 / gene=Cvel_9656 / organism=Chromera_velia_CCMP2878 / gene_product=hypothetical protein / transcript_product=hypothetical protein / location=Cvel_scaffold562:24444-25887(-) / protein_length=309 / sequence_SO=supercontig / SO=protein_coding / is_pseudo=false